MSNFLSSKIDGAPYRALLKARGVNENELSKPLVGIVYAVGALDLEALNAFNLIQSVKEGVIAGGGLPVMLPLSAFSQPFSLGSKFALPHRELTADCTEAIISCHQLDGAVLIGSDSLLLCGLLMGAARTNIPAIALSLGKLEPSLGTTTPLSMFEITGAMRAGKKNILELSSIEESLGGGTGYESSFDCVLEALAAPFGNGTIALGFKRLALAKKVGIEINKLIEGQISLKMLLSKAAFANAITLALSIGASNDCFLNLLALSFECGFDMSTDIIRSYAPKTPALANLSAISLNEFGNLGGVRACLKALDEKKLIDTSAKSFNGESLSFSLGADSLSEDARADLALNSIQTAVLEGNLAEDGSLCRRTEIAKGSEVFNGKAHVFNLEQEALLAIANGTICAGDVVVLRYLGAKAAGMPDVSNVALALKGAELGDTVALVTDARCTISLSAPVVAHVTPEAQEGGTIALVMDGDKITIDLNKNKLTLDLNAKELNARRKKWRPLDIHHTGWLQRYAALVNPASKGATLKNKF